MNTALDRKETNTRDAFLLVAALAVLLASVAYWRTLSAYRAPYRLLQDQPIPPWIDQLYAWRWLVRGAMLAAGAVFAYVELRRAGVTRRLHRILSRRAQALALVVGLALVGRSYLMIPGHMAFHDGLANVAHVVAVRAALEQGHWPPYYWSNYAWLGFPWLQFHNSLLYLEAPLLDLVLHDGYLSTKIVLLANHVLAAASMYVYVRYLTRSAWAGLVSATVWATTFFHYHYFVQVGSMHLAPLLPFMPAALWCVEAVLAGMHTRLAVAGLALAAGLSFWVHTYYGAVSVALLLLYSLATLMVRQAPWRSRMLRLGVVVGAIALGCCIGLSQWLPQFAERNLVGQWYRGYRFSEPIIGWADILSFRQSFLTPDYYGGYVGQSVFGLAVLCVVLALATRDRRMVGPATWLAITLYLSLGPRYLPFDAIFTRIPYGEFVYTVRYPGKYLLFAELALAVLAGAAVREVGRGLYLLRRPPGRFTGSIVLWCRRLALVMAVAVAAEMGYFTLQVNSFYPEAWISTQPGSKEAYEWLRAHGDRTSRVLDRGISDIEVAAFSGQPTLFSHIEESPQSWGLLWHVRDEIRPDVIDGHLQSTTRDGLYMLDFGYVIMLEPPPLDAGWRPGYRGTPFSVWQVSEHSPAVAALALAPVPNSANSTLNDLINDMRIDRSANAAAQIPVSAPVQVPLSADTAEAASEAPLRLAMMHYEVQLNSAALDYEVSRPAYIQLSYSAYPYLRLYLDGQPRDYFWTAFSLVGFVSPAGQHHVELRPYLSPLRVVSYWIDGLGLLAAAILVFTKRRR